MFDYHSIFETSNIETHSRDPEVVFRMRKYEIAVLEDPHGIDPN